MVEMLLNIHIQFQMDTKFKFHMYIYYMEELYKNPKTISGLIEFYKKAKQQDKNITLKDAK